MDWKVQRNALMCAIGDAESPMEALLFSLLYIRDVDGRPLVGHRAYAVWEALPQHTVLIEGGAARIDLALVRNDKRIAIEVDGHEFHERSRDLVIRDNRRQTALSAQGWQVLRVSGSQLWREPIRTVDEIEAVLLQFVESAAPKSVVNDDLLHAMRAAEASGNVVEQNRLLSMAVERARAKRIRR